MRDKASGEVAGIETSPKYVNVRWLGTEDTKLVNTRDTGNGCIIESILVTSPQSVESSMDIRHGMEYRYRYTAAAIHNNLLLLFTGLHHRLYDIRSGKQLWKVDCNPISHVLEWRCDRHAKLVYDRETLYTINMW